MSTYEANAVVSAKTQITPDLMILRIQSLAGEIPAFKPGQFCVLGLPESASRIVYADKEEGIPDPNKWVRRAYSIASSSVERDYLEFYVSMVRSGALTPRLFNLNVGDRLYLGSKMTGMFTFDQVPKDKHIVMVATGTGVAPYMSMIRTFLKEEASRRFAIIQGARHSWDLGYYSELNQLATDHKNFLYMPVVSRGQGEATQWVRYSGHVQDVWKAPHIGQIWKFPPAPDNSHVFLCGNPAMVYDMARLCVEQGFVEHKPKAPGSLHVERYW